MGVCTKSGQGAVFFKIAIGAKLLAGAKRCLPMLEINTPVKHILTNQKRYIFTLCHLFFALWLHRNNKSKSAFDCRQGEIGGVLLRNRKVGRQFWRQKPKPDDETQGKCINNIRYEANCSGKLKNIILQSLVTFIGDHNRKFVWVLILSLWREECLDWFERGYFCGFI